MALCSCWNRFPWAFEIGTIILSVALLGALAGILITFDGRAIFDSDVLTLNTVVAVLSTAAKTNILVVLANCIGQWKWILFAGSPRRLLDFERLDQAAWGPLGSFNLLFNRNVSGARIARFGALTLLIAVAIDPFSQQLVQYEQQVTFVDQPELVTVPRAGRYSKGNEFFLSVAGLVEIEDGTVSTGLNQDAAFADTDFAMQAAIVFGISESTSRISQQVNFECPTSQCRFPKFQSLAVCSACQDLDSRMTKNTASSGTQYVELQRNQDGARAAPNQTEFRLPSGLFMNNLRDEDWNQIVYFTMAGTRFPSKTVAMQELDTLIWSQGILKSDRPEKGQLWGDYAVHATECALYYCVREYTAEVKNGTLVETSIEMKDAKRNPASWQVAAVAIDEGLSEELQKSLVFDARTSILRRTDLQLGSSFNLSQSAVDGISSFVQPTFGPCLNRTGTTCDFDENPVNGFYIAGGDLENGTVQFQPAVAKVLWEAVSIPAVFENVARSMSNALRNGADGADSGSSSSNDPNAGRVAGQIGLATTVYRIHWWWISLHVVVELGAVVFLLWTVWVSNHRFGQPLPAWKTSALATLNRGEMGGAAVGGGGEDGGWHVKRSPSKVDMEDLARNESMTLLRGFRDDGVGSGGYKAVTTEVEMNAKR